MGEERRRPKLTSRPLDHGSTWYVRGRHLHSLEVYAASIFDITYLQETRHLTLRKPINMRFRRKEDKAEREGSFVLSWALLVGESLLYPFPKWYNDSVTLMCYQWRFKRACSTASILMQSSILIVGGVSTYNICWWRLPVPPPKKKTNSHILRTRTRVQYKRTAAGDVHGSEKSAQQQQQTQNIRPALPQPYMYSIRRKYFHIFIL